MAIPQEILDKAADAMDEAMYRNIRGMLPLIARLKRIEALRDKAKEQSTRAAQKKRAAPKKR